VLRKYQASQMASSKEPHLARKHGWRNLFQRGGVQVIAKNLYKIFVIRSGNYDVTSIEI